MCLSASQKYHLQVILPLESNMEIFLNVIALKLVLNDSNIECLLQYYEVVTAIKICSLSWQHGFANNWKRIWRELACTLWPMDVSKLTLFKNHLMNCLRTRSAIFFFIWLQWQAKYFALCFQQIALTESGLFWNFVKWSYK